MTRQIKEAILEALAGAVGTLRSSGRIPAGVQVPILLEIPRLRGHGDLASNVAFLAGRELKTQPAKLAAELVASLEPPPRGVARIEVAGGGFINFFLEPETLVAVLLDIEREGPDYGSGQAGQGKRVLVEFVSANPTGPLHVGHGRNAATGDVLANVLARAGFSVEREYYVNDTGNQIEALGRSLRTRYVELTGRAKAQDEEVVYRGSYLVELAGQLRDEKGDALALEDTGFFTRYAVRAIQSGIDKDLADFGVRFDHWFNEGELHRSGLIEQAVKELESRGFIYEKDGAKWLGSERFGDEKDRVVIRKNGQPTYLAADIAYHKNKLSRGYDRMVDVWGADHHGYIPRAKAAIQALGGKSDALEVVLIQLVKLSRAGKPVPMSTRAGEFVTLREVMDEVGKDAARFFFLMRRSDAQLDFDLELAKSQSADNPVYYVQYAHARIASILRRASEQGIRVPSASEVQLGLIEQDTEFALVKQLAIFPEMIEGAALALEPHRVTSYLQELAALFHNFYDRGIREGEFRVITPNPALTDARLVLAKATKTTIASGLGLLGVSAPETM